MTQISTSAESLRDALLNFRVGYRASHRDGAVTLTPGGVQKSSKRRDIVLPPHPEKAFGSAEFRAVYQVEYNLMAGGMAHGIASEELVIAMGKAGFLASFGTAGLSLARIERAIDAIQAALPDGPYAFNFIHTPADPGGEARLISLYLARNVHVIEAAAFFQPTPALVRYRAAGLSRNKDGSTKVWNRIIAKVSRGEVATHFMSPAPPELLAGLVQSAQITAEQAEMCRAIPLADDVTCEADSAGHTDRAAWLCQLPAMMQLRDRLQAEYRFSTRVRVGSGGGMGTPSAVAAAFFLGADYVVTGSINQACLEAGTSPAAKQLLARAEPSDVAMAPAADMFELGVQVQVLKRGTLFAPRARKLYDCYRNYPSFEAIPQTQRDEIEAKLFRTSAAGIWKLVREYWEARNSQLLLKAETNPKQKMAMLFCWYLGNASHWAIGGDPDRREDYQIWCGPAMGAFNDWVKGTYLEGPEHRNIVDISRHLLEGAAYAARYTALEKEGFDLPSEIRFYVPRPHLKSDSTKSGG